MTDQINLGILWAATGGTTPVTSTKYQTGWVSEIPTFQNFNYMLQGLDQNMLHLAESNSFNWEATINYKAGTKVLRAGVPYVARIDNIGTDPTTDTNNNTWVTGMIVGANFADLLETDGSKVEVGARTGNLFTGVDHSVVNSMPLIELRTTGATFDNWAVANVSGELVASNLGKTGPDGRSLAKDAGNSHRLFHEAHLPLVGEVPGAVPEAPSDGKLYARIGVNATSGTWAPVTSTVVQTAPPPAVLGAGQGWYNLDDGQFYVDINDGDSSQWVAACPPVIPKLAEPVRSVMGSASRNTVMTPDPFKTDSATTVGFSATTYTGNGAAQSVSTGVDMSTGDFGGLVWAKSRSGTGDNALFDTVRGVTKRLTSNGAGAEDTLSGVTSFDSDGFTLGPTFNINGQTSVAWSWQTTNKTTGLTNRNKPYTTHYNPGLGFSIVGYEGDGVKGHEIPHHLGREPELSIFKNRDDALSWVVQSPMFDVSDYLILQTIAALVNIGNRGTLFNEEVCTVGADTSHNTSGDNFISYHFASVEGVSKVGKYIGTGAAGNYVDCGFGGKKAGFVLIKRLSSANSWVTLDSTRLGGELYPNLVNAESVDSTRWDLVSGGFALETSASGLNALNSEYLFMAFADTNATTGRTDYDRPTNGNEVTVADGTVISYANGFDQDGENNFNEDVAGDTVITLPVGSESKELWIYKDQGGSYGTTEFRPLEGVTRNSADKYGLDSPLDEVTRTTSRHSGYESNTGVVSASTENGTSYLAWHAFNKDANDIMTAAVKAIWLATTTTGWLQYKFSEPRVLKSWRIRTGDSISRLPRRFTVEGSNNGLDWTAIDSTYTASDFVGGGISLWSDVQSTSANFVAYTYHRIIITANNGDASYLGLGELELNTVIPSDYYSVPSGIMYDSANSPILRTYIGSVLTDTDGNITQANALPSGKFKGIDAEFHGDVVVHGDILNKGVVSARVSFDGTKSPALVKSGFGFVDVVDTGTGLFEVVVEDSIDLYEASIFAGGEVGTSIANTKITVLSKTRFQLVTWNAQTLAEPNWINVIVIGGKS